MGTLVEAIAEYSKNQMKNLKEASSPILIKLEGQKMVVDKFYCMGLAIFGKESSSPNVFNLEALSSNLGEKESLSPYLANFMY